jgi:hypothetical protein
VTINAIETYYSGHFFRSRLEARWATVFNELGIKWEYEPQGFRVGDSQKPYLPDFRLPDINWWVEVKGTEERLDTALLADAVHPTKGLAHDGSGNNLLILGPIPDTRGATPLHYAISQASSCGELHRCGDDCGYPPPFYCLDWLLCPDDLQALGVDTSDVKPKDLTTWRKWGAYPIPVGRAQTTVPKADLTKAVLAPRLPAGPRLEAAYTLGRTARFEHEAAA